MTDMTIEEYKNLLIALATDLESLDRDSGLSYPFLEMRITIYEKLIKVGKRCRVLIEADSLDLAKNFYIYSLERYCKECLDQILGKYYASIPHLDCNTSSISNAFNRIKSELQAFYGGDTSSVEILEPNFVELSELACTCAKTSVDVLNSVESHMSDVFKIIEAANQKLKIPDDELKTFLCDYYYTYLEEHSEEIADGFYNEIYKRELIKDTSIEPKPTDYSNLHNGHMTSLMMGKKTKIIQEKFNLRKPLDIRNDVFLKHMEHECTTENDMQLFCRCFAETAILHSLFRPKIPLLQRPVEVKPLPECVNEQIRERDQLVLDFRGVMRDLLVFAMRTEAKTKYCHIKRVLEDDGLTGTMNESEFGRLAENILPELKAANVTRTLNNNRLADKVNDVGLPYYEWTINTPTKQQCDKISKRFENIRNQLM